MKTIDLRSDTVTEPTDEMRRAMAEAMVGDDVYDDDILTNRLQETAAKMLGKEKALFVPSGTFGNQLCILSHTRPGNEVIVDDAAHIVLHEAGASGLISGVQLRAYDSPGGKTDAEAIRNRIRKDDDIHYPKTALICLENARSDGMVISLDEMKAVREVSKEFHIPVHIDGARIFNAMEHLSIDAAELAPLYDSMTFCLSKGLCAPIGSIVAGTEKFIDRAKRFRKIMGGGMRQTGILAAAGQIALEIMVKRVGEDHKNAKYLYEKLSGLPKVEMLPMENVHISMVFFKYNGNSHKLVENLAKSGIIINPAEEGLMRFVTHYWITKERIDFVMDEMRKVL